MESDAALARRLAAGAGELLTDLRRESGLTGRALADKGDQVSQDYLAG
jgi:3'(2'), 5'-bisphosphate nucleotidase